MPKGRPQLSCANCAKPMHKRPQSLPQGNATCQECRSASALIANPSRPRTGATRASRAPDLRRNRQPYGSKRGHCANCGEIMWRGKGMLPDGQATCQPCRRANPISMEPGKRKPRKTHTQTCKHCGIEYERRNPNKGWCSTKCYGDSRVIRADCDWGRDRGKREASAPGLTKNGRDKLRAKWKQQQKPCAYCDARADTIDHVMPLVRGGTNYEGNLVPACRRCNGSKSGKTIVEWRHGVSLGKVREAPDWMGKLRVHRERKPKPVKAPREPHACPMCQKPTLRMKYCSQECATERERRYIRDKWRARNGLTVDPMRPTSKWAA